MTHSTRVHAELLLSHTEWSRALALRLVHEAADADELLQDTAVRVLERPPAERGNVRGWLAAVMKSVLAQRRRGDARRRARERASAQPERVTSGADAIERASMHRLLVDTLMRLDEPWRTTLVLRYFDDLGPRQIAARLGVPLDTVRSRLRHGLAEMRERLDRSNGGDREAWLEGLAPLAALPRSGVSLSTAQGVLIMNAKLKTVLAVACLVGGLSFLPRVLSPAAPTPPSLDVEGRNLAAVELGTPVETPAVSAGEGGQRTTIEQASVESEEPFESATPTMVVVGLVLDLDARPTGAVQLEYAPEEGDRVAFESAADGHFEVAVPLGAGTISCVHPGLTTMLAGDVEPDAGATLIVVCARSIDIGGSVGDAEGRPVSGTEIELVVPRGVQRRFPYVLDASLEIERVVRTDASGRFALNGVPAVQGSQLVTRSEGFLPDERAAPLITRTDVRIELQSVEAAGAPLRGTVLDEHGEPVAGARVGAALAVTRTDARGVFAFAPEVRAEAREVVAVTQGALPGRERALETPEGPAWPDHVVVRLGGEPLDLTGIVVDGDGRPVAGAHVYVADPTKLGNEDGAPSHVEGFIAGIGSKPEVEREGAPLANTPTSFWSWVVTDADGRFHLRGLLARDYRLRAFHAETLAMVDAGPFRGGERVVRLVLPLEDGSSVAGRVVDASGDPVAGARVRSFQRAFTVRGIGEVTHSWDRSGPADSSDANGRFALGHVARSGVWLLVDADGFRTRSVRLDEVADTDEVLIELDANQVAVGHFQLVLGETKRADAFALVDRFGEPLPIMLRRGGYRTSRERWELVDGRSYVLYASANAAELVLFLDGVEVERTPVALVEGELVTLER
ncbi:MAG: sigma-70 family RNA polymerase sigma factor [bacterium]|nr:sigma-70 family RNA polymerase sigma factor [bacterium]